MTTQLQDNYTIEPTLRRSPLAAVALTTAWYLYATLATILTLGLFIRFHLITVRKRTLGGVRAGTFGCTHVYRESSFLVVSTWHGKQRYPVTQVSYAETGLFKVRVATSGSRRRGGSKLRTWQTRTVSDFINSQVAS